MKSAESGTVLGLSMVLTAIVKSLPQEVAHQVARELRASSLDARARDETEATPKAEADARNSITRMYLDGLNQVIDGSVLLVGGGKK